MIGAYIRAYEGWELIRVCQGSQKKVIHFKMSLIYYYRTNQTSISYVPYFKTLPYKQVK